MFDHAAINARYEALCERSRVLPPIDLHPIGGDVRFYARTEHIRGSSQRFGVACALRAAMHAAINEPIMGGDIWLKPTLTGETQ